MFTDAKKCTAKSKRTGLPCNGVAVTGYRVCRMHGGGGGRPRAGVPQSVLRSKDFQSRVDRHRADPELRDFGRMVAELKAASEYAIEALQSAPDDVETVGKFAPILGNIVAQQAKILKIEADVLSDFRLTKVQCAMMFAMLRAALNELPEPYRQNAVDRVEVGLRAGAEVGLQALVESEITLAYNAIKRLP